MPGRPILIGLEKREDALELVPRGECAPRYVAVR
jgi:hypothetical protein